MNFALVDGEGEEGVLVIFSDSTDVGERGPEEGWCRRADGLVFRAGWGRHGGYPEDGIREIAWPEPSSRMVENSKSMTQKRPSATR